MKNMSKWFWAFVGTAVALVAAIVVCIVLGINLGAQPDEIPEGAESGLFYYDTDSAEYSLTLHSGNKFTYFDGVNKVGEYTIAEDGTISFVFDKESNGTATGKYANDVLTFTYFDESMRFLRKISYTVEFNSNGGSAVNKAVVANGRLVAKPDDPTKLGYVFIGWYTDAALTTPVDFATDRVTANTTLHAKWIAKEDNEFTISFEGAELNSMSTIGGTAQGLPTPTKEGFTFGGWWYSFTEEADKIAYKVENGDTITANVTLFAVWVAEGGSKLPAPLAEVDKTGISWNAVAGAATYTVKITAPDGKVTTESVSATTLNFTFDKSGEYKVEVTAVSTESADKNSETTTRYYIPNALDRVSGFKVIEGTILLFNPVAGAEKYYITIKCGDDTHEHVRIDNGNSTYYNFASCKMVEGGVEFVVYAAAEGKAESYSKTFKYERRLDAVTGFATDATTEVLTWNPVAGATAYNVTVNCTEHGAHTVTVTDNKFDYKFCSGTVTVKVVPFAANYLLPAEATYTITKTTLAAPAGVTVVGNTVSWTAVKNATSYVVTIGSWTTTVSTNSVDLSTAAGFDAEAGDELTITVTAKGAENVMSLASDPVVAAYMDFAGITEYKGGYVYWAPVAGISGRYEIKVNDGESVFADGTFATAPAFTKKGANTIAVRFVSDSFTSDWKEYSVMAYEIAFDSQLGSFVESIFVATGDMMDLTETVVRTGYTFDGWYNSTTLGTLYTDGEFTDAKDVVLYAKWVPNTYKVTLNVTEGVTGVDNGTKFDVVFDSDDFTLPVPAKDGEVFKGWYSAAGGAGVRYTDGRGEAVRAYDIAEDSNFYPYFISGVFAFTKVEGGYAVKGGTAIGLVEDANIPDTYQNEPVVEILENAFYNCTTLKTVSFPNTVNVVGVGAFTSCKNLTDIEVREIEGVTDPTYSSYDGALIMDYFGTIYLEYFPRSKAGEYTIPEGVTAIRNKAFATCYYVTKVNVASTVATVAESAFYDCRKLDTISFVGKGISPLTIADGAFERANVLTTLELPARLASVNFETFEVCPKLETITVEKGGNYFGSVDGFVTNGNCDTILYCPPVVKNPNLTFSTDIVAVGEGAFKNRTAITTVAIPNWVSSIGKSAFEGCTGLASVAIEAPGASGLDIADSAFKGCSNLKSVEFGAQLSRSTAGLITIGANAFEGCADLTTINIGESTVSTIGANAFKDCTSLTEVTFPATATTVAEKAFSGCTKISKVFFNNENDIAFGGYVFENCTNLTEVTLPKSLTEFDGSVFDGCDNIASIKVHPENEILKSTDNGVLLSKDGTEVIYYPRALAIDFTALTGVTKIGAAAFQANVATEKLVIPASVTTIGEKAFEGCTFTEVEFADMTAAVSIGDYAFANCKKLTAVAIPAGNTAVGAYAFSGDTALASATLSANTVNVGAYAFEKTALVDVVIPASVATIGDGAFSGISTLNSFTVNAPATGAATVALSLGTADDTFGVFNGSPVKTVTLANRVTVIGAHAFENISSLKSFNFSELTALKTIADFAFASATNGEITEVVLPEGLEVVGNSAFYSFWSLAKVTVPTTVTTLGNDVFRYCNLDTVTFTPGGNAPLAIGDYAFAGSYPLKSITFPARLDSVFSYVNVGNNANIGITSFYTLFDGCGQMAEINVDPACEKFGSDEGIFYIKNNGKLTELVYCPRKKVNAKEADGTTVIPVTIPSTVELVHNGAFVSTGNGLTQVVFEEIENWDGVSTLVLGVAEITSETASTDKAKWGVFGKSNYFELIQLPKHLKKLNSLAFTDLDNSSKPLNLVFNLESNPVEFCDYAIYGVGGIGSKTNPPTDYTFTLPKLSRLGNYAFTRDGGSYYIGTINFTAGSTLTAIGESAFTSHSRVISYTNIPSTVESFGGFAFNSNSKLESITFEGGVSNLKSVGSACFQSASFTSFVFPNTVENIGSGVFTGCTKLASITLPASLKSGLSADGGAIFSNLTALTEIKLGGNSDYLNVVDGVLYSKDGTALLLYPAKKAVTALNLVLATENPKSAFDATYNAVNAAGETVFTVLFDSKAATATIAVAGTKSQVVYSYVIDKTTGNVTFTDANKTAVNAALASVTLAENVPATLTYANFVVPATVTSIEPYALYKYAGLAITLPNGLVNIKEYAINSTTTMESITIPGTVQTIERFALGSNSKLTTITFEKTRSLTIVGASAFATNYKLDNVVLPDSVVDLGDRAFSTCTSLTKVTLPAGLTNLPKYLFNACTALSSIKIPETVTTINGGAFYGCTSLELVTIPAAVTEIRRDGYDDGAFANCSKLGAVVFATKGCQLEYIAVRTFNGCSSLTSIDLPASLISLETGLFEGCANITSVTLAGTWTDIPANFFKNVTTLTTVKFGANVKNIGESAFEGCVNLNNVDLPKELVSVGKAAFKGCTAMTSVEIPATVTSVGDFAFENCTALATVDFADGIDLKALGTDDNDDCGIFRNTTALTTISIPSSVTTIGANIFENSGLTSVVLSNNIKAISDYAFAGCTALEQVDIPANADSIGTNAFFGCSALEVVNMSEGIESIGSGAFRGCAALEEVYLSDALRNLDGNPFVNCANLFIDLSVTNTSYVIVDGALYTSDMHTLVYYLPTNTAATFTVPETVKVIAPGAFACSQLVSFTFPANMTTVPDMLFLGSTKLESVNFNNVEVIGSEVFAGCTALKNIEIPASVTTIGEKAFQGAGLESVTFAKRNTKYSIGAYAFADCTSLTNIALDGNFAGFTPYMLSNTGFVIYNLPSTITNLDVEGVFAGCKKLTTFNFGTFSGKTIGQNFFMDCTAIVTITLPKSVTTLGKTYEGGVPYYAGATSIAKRFMGVEYSGAFRGCTALTSINLGNVNGIGDYAFYGCTSLKTVNWPTKLYAIGDYAFASSGLEAVDMTGITSNNSSSLKASLESFVFADCTSLKTVKLPTKSQLIYEMGDGFFARCVNLELVEFNTGAITQFGLNASPFQGLTSKTVIKFTIAAKTVVNNYNMTENVNYNYADNTKWYQDTDAVLLGSDNNRITKTGGTEAYVAPKA